MMNSPFTTEQWAKLKQSFTAIAELPQSLRPQAIEEACGGDDDLRRELESLLAADDRACGFIDHSPAAPPDLGQRTPETIGPYHVLREIGHGGMGSVYLAERRGEFHQQVAVKLVRAGVHNAYVLRRFTVERQILAGLEHPNIARLLDGGTTSDGLPYFVMEHVEGAPIDVFCRERGLSVADTLALFIRVSAGVQAAHQRLIVHRDLKPSNILVTPDGTPKLLDFGIAKLLDGTGEPEETATELRAMTPEYASPEQVAARPLTMASDVYALGVVLYELLSGQKPYRFERRSAAEIAHVVLETIPLKPSAVALQSGNAVRARQLRGDLDTIILRALHKDPERRYPSVDALAADLQRHLDGRPVLARPDSLGYRSQKFIRRNAGALAATFLLVLILIAGVAATWWKAVEARQAQAKAERRFAELRKLANVLIFDLEPQIAELSGGTAIRQKLVANALQYLDRLAGEADDPALQIELASAYRKIAEVQGNPYQSNLGDLAAAERSYAKSRQILERLLPLRPRDPLLLNALGQTYAGIGDVVYHRNDLLPAEAMYRKSIAVQRQSAAITRPALADRRFLTSIMVRRADLLGHPGYSNLGRADEALTEERNALRLREALAAEFPKDERAARDVSESLVKIASIESAIGDLAASAESNRRAVEILAEIVARHPDAASDQQDLSLAYLMTAIPMRETGRQTEALAYVRKSLTTMERLAKNDPSSALWQRNLSVIHNHLAQTLIEIGDARAAQESSAEAVALAETLWRVDRTNHDAALDLAIALRRSTESLLLLGRNADVVRQGQHALELLDLIGTTENQRAALEHALVETRMGCALAADGRSAEGLRLLEHSREALEALARGNEGDVQLKDELAGTLLNEGDVRKAIGAANACARYAASAQIWDDLRGKGKLRWRSRDVATTASEKAQSCS